MTTKKEAEETFEKNIKSLAKLDALMFVCVVMLVSCLLIIILSAIYHRQANNFEVIYFDDKYESQGLASYINENFTMAPDKDDYQSFRALKSIKYPASIDGGVSVCFDDECFLLNRYGYQIKYINAKYDEFNQKWLVEISQDDIFNSPRSQSREISNWVYDAIGLKEAKEFHLQGKEIGE